MTTKGTCIALTMMTLLAASSPALARDHSGSGSAGGHSAASAGHKSPGDSGDGEDVYSATENYREHFGPGATASPSMMAPGGRYTRG